MIKKEDLIEAGWPQSPLYSELIEAARSYEERGISDPAYILKLLARDFPKPDPKLRQRPEPISFGEAIEATNEEDQANIQAVRRCMGQLLRTPVITGGAIMPDACPAGAGEAVIPVGGAIAVEHAILPAAHSADICCSMYATFFETESAASELLDQLKKSTRFGPGGRKKEDLVPHPVIDEDVWQNRFLNGLQKYAAIHMADQGDGNHFAYLGKVCIDKKFIAKLTENGYDEIAQALQPALQASPDGKTRELHALVTHHGSRGLGAQLYKRGHKAAIRETERIAEGIPKAAAWLDTRTELGAEYWEALQYISRWTLANHQSIHQRFLEFSESTKVTEFGNEHNFVWKKGDSTYLHGKGATPAWNDEAGNPLLGLIPLNMAEPILITLGKNNPDYLGFAPHGAGRNRSRTATLRAFKNRKGEIDQAKVAREIAQSTAGLDIRWWHGEADLSESPIGYKNASQVREQIEKFDLAEVVALIEPLGCIMAGGGNTPPWRSRKEQLSPKQIRQIDHRANRRKEKQKWNRGTIDPDYGDE